MASLTGSTTAVFFVRLSTAVDEIVDVDWNTRDGTAIAGQDYEAARGTMSFIPGETEKAIDVVVYGQDDVSADGKKFYIELKPPVNAVLTDAMAECVITVADEDGVLVTSLVIAQGKRGFKGNPGLSAYEQAVLMGYTGTLAEWMNQIADASKAADRAAEHAVYAAEDALKAQNAAKNAVFAGVVFPTAAEGVDPVLGVQNGAYFNVRSLLSEHYIDEYQNVNGAAVATGKSYPASDYVQYISEHTALPFVLETAYKLNQRVVLTNGDIVKSTVDGNVNNPNVNMTGWANPNKDLKDTVNKIAPLDTIPTDVDATQFLQSLIDKMTDGMTLDLLGRTFNVSKSTAYQSLYPANDQPCLIVYNKKNIKITNGKLKTDKHGQGIIDFRNCPNWLLDGVELEGFGNNFPPIDGVTGRAEKTGSSTEGYYYNADGLLPRNNSVDTSTRTTGGYGGNFPQFGGGVAATWGMWGGGFICNIAYGVYQEDSFGRAQNCKIHGFNGSGVFGKNYKSMIVMHSEIFNCYVAGVESYGLNTLSKQPEMYLTAFNSIHDIGHPSASVSHNAIDPGYGITTANSNNGFGRPKVYMTQGNVVSRCKRKGIDAHSSDIIIAKNNVVSETGFGIVSVTNLGTNPKSVTIIGNTVENIQYCASDSAHGIQVRGINRNSGVAVVSNNTVKNVGRPITSLLASISGRSIFIANTLSATVSGNTIENDGYIADLGIGSATNVSQYCPNFVCTGNQIKGMFRMGIFIYGVADSISSIEKLKQSFLANSNAIHLYSLKPHFNQDQFCISSFKSAKTTGNLLIIDDYVRAKYLNDFAERRSAANEEVWFSIVKDASGYVLNVKSQSGGMPIDISQITSSVESNKLKIVIPSFYPMPIDSAISQKNQLKTTSGVPVNSLYMAQDNFTRSLTLNLENINGSTITPVNFQDLAVGCELSVNLKF